MGMSEGKNRRPRWRRKVWVALPLVLVIALAAGWVYLQRVADVERLHPALESWLAEATGAPVIVDTLELHLFPSPRLGVANARIGGEAWWVEAEAFRARTHLLPLLRGRVHVDTVEVERLRLHLAEDGLEDARAAVERLVDAAQGRDARSGNGIAVDTLHIAHLEMTHGPRNWFDGAAVLHAVTSRRPALEAHGRMGALGPRAELEISAALQREHAQEIILSGVASLDQVLFQELLPITLQGGVSLRADFEGALDDLALRLNGELRGTEQGVLDGPLTAEAWWRGGKLILNDVRLDSHSVHLAADATLEPGVAPAVALARLELKDLGLDLVLNAWGGGVLTAERGARLLVEDLLAGAVDGQPRIAQGSIAFHGLHVRAPDTPFSLQGLSGEATVVENEITFSRLEAPGLQLAGTLVPDLPSSTVAVRANGQATLEALDLPPSPLRELAGTVDVEALSATLGGGESGKDVVLHARLAGVSALYDLDAAPEPLRLREVSGELRYADGEWTLREITGEGVRLDGVIESTGGGGASFDLTGNLRLDSNLLAMAVPVRSLREYSGEAAFARVSGTYRPGEGVPEDLVVEGELREAAATLMISGRPERFDQLQASFSTEGDTITASVEGYSETVGAAQFSGTYAVRERRLQGEGTGDVSRALQLIPKFPESLVTIARESFGRTQVVMDSTLHGPGSPTAHFQLEHKGVPDASAQFSIAIAPGESELTSIEVRAILPASSVSTLIPPQLSLEGPAMCVFQRRPGEPGFHLRADMDQVNARLGPYLEKRVGDPMHLVLNGNVIEKSWQLEDGVLHLLGQQVPLELGTGGLQSARIDLELGALAPLLPEGGSASGRITGTFAAMPTRARVQFHDAALHLSPGLALDTTGGELDFEDGVWRGRDLHISGERNDCTLSGEFSTAHWNARVAGSSLDLDTTLELLDTWREYRQMHGMDAQETPGGNIALEIDTVHYRRGTLQNVHTQIGLRGSHVEYNDLRFQPYQGQVTGRVIQYPRPDAPSLLDMRLQFEDADLRALDDLLLSEPRGLEGLVSGHVTAQGPASSEQFLKELSGDIDFTARSGTYGRLGWSTRLITVLKTTEVLRLRLPTLRDSGLSFEDSSASLTFNNGLMQIRRFEVVDRAYSIEGDGQVNFPGEQSDINLRLYMLESVSGLVGNVPILRSTVGLLKRASSLRLHATGPPSDLIIRPDPLGLETVRPAPGNAEE